jgi:electron transfer flavoprotein alpha subunit
MTNASTLLIVADTFGPDPEFGIAVLYGLASAVSAASPGTKIVTCILTRELQSLSSSTVAGVAAAYAAQIQELSASTQAEAIVTELIELLNPDRIAAVGTPILQHGLARASAVKGLAHISGVSELAVDNDGDGVCISRSIYSGEYAITVRLPTRCSFTVVPHKFAARPPIVDSQKPIQQLSLQVPPPPLAVDQPAVQSHERPALNRASVAVGGGSALRNSETFNTLIGGLADLLGGAAGATRAAVDAGIAPPDLQVGQTGVHLSADLYIAAGVSGAIQHTAGIRDVRTVVAINTDPQAPIFRSADYGIIGDLHSIIPDLMSELK